MAACHRQAEGTRPASIGSNPDAWPPFQGVLQRILGRRADRTVQKSGDAVTDFEQETQTMTKTPAVPACYGKATVGTAG